MSSRTGKNISFFCGLTLAMWVSGVASADAEVWPTRGEVWPKPQTQIKYDKSYIVEPEKFEFYAPTQSCALLEEALQRYWRIITAEFSPKLRNVRPRVRTRRSKKKSSKKPWPNRRKLNNAKEQRHNHTDEPRRQDYARLSPQASVRLRPSSRDHLSQLRVQLIKPCEDLPHLEMDESYELSVGPTNRGLPAAVLDSRSVWGALRGLETFSQLLHRPSLYSDVIHINVTHIRDFPRFRHRGLLLDTSRHFLPTYRILQVLDGMSYNKLNVFHWHIVDDQSFPYQSLRFPTLSEQGAFHNQAMVYTLQEVRMVVEHARARGIRVLPEFDIPGHTRSWGKAFPSLLVQCYQNGKATGTLGPMDPTSEFTYRFLENLFAEVMEVFTDEYFHYGGDEVDYKCWESNPKIMGFMRQYNLTSPRLHNGFTVRLLGAARRRPVLWSDAADGVNLPLDTLIQIWRDSGSEEITKLTELGHHVIFSSCWYLAENTWLKMYECEPRGLVPRPDLEPFVIGGEACMWGEMVDYANVLTSIFPRTCATAERLWSSLGTTDVIDAAHRLEEHTCRINRRGIDARPANGPGFCF